MRHYFLLLLVGALLSCDAQPKATPTRLKSAVSVHPSDTVRLSQDSSMLQIPTTVQEDVIPPPPPDSIMAFAGVNPMKFTYVSNADLHTILLNSGLAATPLLGRFLLINKEHKPLRLYYQPIPGKGDWIETRLEAMGNAFRDNCQLTLIKGWLGTKPTPVVWVTMEWKKSDNKGESISRVINLIDITHEPRLLLRAWPFVSRVSASHDVGASTNELRCEQKIILRNHEVVISEPTDVGDCSGELVWLPWGRYRYRHGELHYPMQPCSCCKQGY